MFSFIPITFIVLHLSYLCVHIWFQWINWKLNVNFFFPFVDQLRIDNKFWKAFFKFHWFNSWNLFVILVVHLYLIFISISILIIFSICQGYQIFLIQVVLTFIRFRFIIRFRSKRKKLILNARLSFVWIMDIKRWTNFIIHATISLSEIVNNRLIYHGGVIPTSPSLNDGLFLHLKHLHLLPFQVF